MDFDERRRDEVIRYATERYGSDHVAQIITFQTIKGKQGIRDAARVLGFPAVVGDRLCKMYPPAVMGRDYPIEDALKESPEFREAYEKEPEAKEIVDTARALEGLRREDSVHAAGVVIGDAPLVNYLPLKLSKDSRDDSKRVVTQFDMHRRRDARPAEDGLPGAADALRDRRHRPASAGARRRARHRPHPAGRRGDVRHAPERRHDRRLPDGVGGDALADQDARARPVRGPDGARRALPAGPAERRGCTPSTPSASTRAARSRTRIRTWKRSSSTTYGVMVYQEQIMQIAVRDRRLLHGTGRRSAPRHGARRSAS